MQKLSAIVFISILFLSGCSFPGVYKINVQQGNIVTDAELAELSEGMPKSQVRAILGTPLVINPLDSDQDYYVYTFQRRGGEVKEQRIVVYYQDDRYTHHQAKLLEETPAY